jgi:hypothetical protein
MGSMSEATRFNLISFWLPVLNILLLPLVILGSIWFLVPQILVLLFQMALYWRWV